MQTAAPADCGRFEIGWQASAGTCQRMASQRDPPRDFRIGKTLWIKGFSFLVNLLVNRFSSDSFSKSTIKILLFVACVLLA